MRGQAGQTLAKELIIQPTCLRYYRDLATDSLVRTPPRVETLNTVTFRVLIIRLEIKSSRNYISGDPILRLSPSTSGWKVNLA